MFENLKIWWYDRDLNDMMRDGQIDMETYLEIRQTRKDVKDAVIMAGFAVVFIALIVAAVL